MHVDLSKLPLLLMIFLLLTWLWNSVQVEMILQALEYEIGKVFHSFAVTLLAFLSFSSDIFTLVTEHGKVLDEFFISTAGRFNYFDVI